MKRACLALLLAAAPAAALEVPSLDGRISDQAGLLSPRSQRELTRKLADHEARNGDQIAILTLSSLEGESLEDFSLRAARAWKLGQKGRDNGLLLLVAAEERKVRIEVGRGLEDALPDELCARIIRDELAPAFQRQDYDGGLRAGVDAVLAALGGSYAPKPEPGSSSGFGDMTPDMDPAMRILMGAFIFGIIGLFTAIGILIPEATGWFLYFFLIPFWAMFPIVIVGPRGALFTLGGHLVGFPLLRLLLPRTEWGRRLAGGFRTSGSAGGGGFRGGGASGSW